MKDIKKESCRHKDVSHTETIVILGKTYTCQVCSNCGEQFSPLGAEVPSKSDMEKFLSKKK